MSGFHSRLLEYEEPGRFSGTRERNEAEAIFESLTGIKPERPYYQNHDEKTARKILALAGSLADFYMLGKTDERKNISSKISDMIMGL